MIRHVRSQVRVFCHGKHGSAVTKSQNQCKSLRYAVLQPCLRVGYNLKRAKTDKIGQLPRPQGATNYAQAADS